MGKVIEMLTDDRDFDIAQTLGAHGEAINGLKTDVRSLRTENTTQHSETSKKVDRIQWGIVLLLASICMVFLQQLFK